MIKVLYIIDSSSIGGSTTAILNMLDGLKGKVKPYVVLPGDGPMVEKIKERNLDYSVLKYSLTNYPRKITKGVFYRFPKTLLNDLISYYKILKLIDKIQPDIIQTNVGPQIIGYHAAKKKGIPHVWHIREFMDKDFSMKPIPTWEKHVKKYHDTDNNYCITITKSVTQHFNLTKNTIQIYDGVINGEMPPLIKENKDNYFLFAGRVENAKGIFELLRAYVDYCEKGGETLLKIAGRGTEDNLNKCEKILRNTKAQNKVEFLGHRNDVTSLMASAKALFVPSHFEGFGFITTEAMYNHCLVVGRNTAGTKEQFDNGLEITGHEIGIRFEKDEEMTEIMLQLDCHPEIWKEYSKRAYEVVRQLYTISVHSNKIYQLYLDILNK